MFFLSCQDKELDDSAFAQKVKSRQMSSTTAEILLNLPRASVIQDINGEELVLMNDSNSDQEDLMNGDDDDFDEEKVKPVC